MLQLEPELRERLLQLIEAVLVSHSQWQTFMRASLQDQPIILELLDWSKDPEAFATQLVELSLEHDTPNADRPLLDTLLEKLREQTIANFREEFEQCLALLQEARTHQTTNKDRDAFVQNERQTLADERAVTVGGDASGSTIVTGDHNEIVYVKTDGAAYIAGDANITNGDFVGRDKYVSVVYQGLSAEQVKEVIEILRSVDQPQTWDGRDPYIGLKSYQEDDAEFFCGREKLVDELIGRVQLANFICVGGPSGSGKSSLIRAGLLPALRQGRLVGSKRWLYATFSPHDAPLEQLALAMTRLDATQVAAQAIRSNGLTQPDELYKQIERLLPDAPERRCVLIIDQFEELFTQTKNEAERIAFVRLLTTAAMHPNSRAIIILTLRSDFLSPCANYPQLRSLISQQFQLVGAMEPQELLKAIVMPVLKVGASIKPELVSQIINDMRGEPGALPLMQFGLQELFTAAKPQKEKPVILTLEAYTQKGGIYGILERHADGVLKSLAKDQLPVARHIFSNLVEVGRDTADTRRIVLFSELISPQIDAQAIEPVLMRLAEPQARLISVGDTESEDSEKVTEANALVVNPQSLPIVRKKWDETVRIWVARVSLRKTHISNQPVEFNTPNRKQQTVTIAHEKLIDAWPWLKALVDENREARRYQQTLEETRRTWEESKYDPSCLLRGRQLEDALLWLKKYPDWVTNDQATFLTKSRKNERWRKSLSSGAIGFIGLLLIPGLFVGANAWMFWQRQHSRWQPIAGFPSQSVTVVTAASETPKASASSICVGTDHIGVGCTQDNISWNLYEDGIPTGTPDWFNSRELLWGALVGGEWSGRIRTVYALAFDPKDSSRLLAFFGGEGLYYSSNGGVDWHQLRPEPTSPEFPKLGASKIYIRGNYIFVASGRAFPDTLEEGRLFVGSTHDQAWQPIQDSANKTGKINDFWVNPQTTKGPVLFFVAEQGLFRASRDNQWHPEKLFSKPDGHELSWITYDEQRQVFYLAGYDAENDWSYLYRWWVGDPQPKLWGKGHAGQIVDFVVNPGDRVSGILWLLCERGEVFTVDEVFAVDQEGVLTSYGSRPGWFWAQTNSLWFARDPEGKPGDYAPYLAHNDGILKCKDCLIKDH